MILTHDGTMKKSINNVCQKIKNYYNIYFIKIYLNMEMTSEYILFIINQNRKP
jgi:hypothetical protein